MYILTGTDPILDGPLMRDEPVKFVSLRGAAASSANAASRDGEPAGAAHADGTSLAVGLTAPRRSEHLEIRALIEREYPGLRMLIAQRAGDAQLGADILNDAICTTWEKWQRGQVARPDQLPGYVFRVALNLLRNFRRTVAAQPERRASATDLDAVPSGSEPSNDLAQQQIEARVRVLLREMGSERDRSVLVRFYLEEEDKETIRRDLQLTSLQFDKVLHRARRRLRTLLEASGARRSDFMCIFGAL